MIKQEMITVKNPGEWRAQEIIHALEKILTTKKRHERHAELRRSRRSKRILNMPKGEIK